MRAALVLTVLSACLVPPDGHRRPEPLFIPPVLPECLAVSGSVGCPLASDEVLLTPHAGFNSFHRSNSKQPAGAPPGKVHYARFWWSELEPVEGQVDFDVVEREFAPARAEGQQFAFRVMAEDGEAVRVPKWMVDQGYGRFGTREGARSYAPDTTTPRYLAAVQRTLAALATKYADDPLLDHVEVGFVGSAGEWAYSVDELPMPNGAIAGELVAAHQRAFPKVPVVMMVGSVTDGAEPLRAALAKGTGWRADCWGDLRRGWNHHDRFYDQQLEAAGALDAWKKAPVMLETCGVMSDWDVMGLTDDQFRWVLGWALDHHASQVNNKSSPVPRRWKAIVDEFQRALGARFIVHRATVARLGAEQQVKVLLANRGAAPFYAPLRLSVRARRGELTLAAGTAPDELGWLVDQRELEVRLAADAPMTLEVSLVTPDGRPAPLLANVGRSSDGWVPVLELH